MAEGLDPTVTPTTEDEQLNKFELYIAEKAQEFMRLLMEAGFEVQSVLENGLKYIREDNCCTPLQAAKAVHQAASNLHINAEYQRRASRMASQEIRERIGIIH